MSERLERVEQFYAARGLPAMFQLGGTTQPHDLDQALAVRGYVIDSPVSIQAAALTACRTSLPSGAQLTVQTAASMGQAWFELAGRQGRFRDSQVIFRGILQRIGSRAGFTLAQVDGEPVGTGLAIRQGVWLGVYAMAVLPPARRQGAGRALLASMLDWGRRGGATRAYLLVERSNLPALGLYRSCGFEEISGYHYRVLAPNEARDPRRNET